MRLPWNCARRAVGTRSPRWKSPAAGVGTIDRAHSHVAATRIHRDDLQHLDERLERLQSVGRFDDEDGGCRGVGVGVIPSVEGGAEGGVDEAREALAEAGSLSYSPNAFCAFARGTTRRGE